MIWHVEISGCLEGNMKHEPLAKVAVVELGNRLGGHDFLALHHVVRGKVLQGGAAARLHVFLPEPVTDLALVRGLAQVIEQADAAASPFRLLVQLHLAELGLLVWVRRHHVALAAALRGEVPLAELGAEELQHHLGLQRPVAHEDGRGDAHGVGVIVEPLLAGRVRELADVFGDIGAEQAVVVAHLEVLVAAEHLHEINEVGAQAFRMVVLRVLQEPRARVTIEASRFFVDRPAALLVPVVLAAFDIATKVRVFGQSGRHGLGQI